MSVISSILFNPIFIIAAVIVLFVFLVYITSVKSKKHPRSKSITNKINDINKKIVGNKRMEKKIKKRK